MGRALDPLSAAWQFFRARPFTVIGCVLGLGFFGYIDLQQSQDIERIEKTVVKRPQIRTTIRTSLRHLTRAQKRALLKDLLSVASNPEVAHLQAEAGRLRRAEARHPVERGGSDGSPPASTNPPSTGGGGGGGNSGGGGGSGGGTAPGPSPTPSPTPTPTPAPTPSGPVEDLLKSLPKLEVPKVPDVKLGIGNQ